MVQASKAAQDAAANLKNSDLESLVESTLMATKSAGNTEDVDQRIYSEIASRVAHEIVRELSAADSQFLKELKNIVQSIDATKAEIATIRPKELAEKELPDAANSLDIIIQTSEEAASSILGCAEELMDVAQFVPAKLNERLSDIATRLFESSNFDDLNGQRVRRVIKTLRGIEERLKSLLKAHGESYEGIQDAEQPSVDERSDSEKLMNGPQDMGQAASQEEIDAILNSF